MEFKRVLFGYFIYVLWCKSMRSCLLNDKIYYVAKFWLKSQETMLHKNIKLKNVFRTSFTLKIEYIIEHDNVYQISRSKASFNLT